MYCWQRNLMDESFPFDLFIADDVEFPPHWHEEFEIVYVLEESLTIGVNSEIYNLKYRDILLIGQGEVHYFRPQPREPKRLIVQFTPAILESLAPMLRHCRFPAPLIRSDSDAALIHHRLEQQILMAQAEYRCKQDGYQLAIKARLFDLVTILLRQVPNEKCSVGEKNKQLQKLGRLEQVFRFVEANYNREVTLPEVAAATGFSVYHFTRFFKAMTGITFIQYYNHFRIAKVIGELNNSNDSLTEIAFRSGFNSIQTFNRVFKQIKGCSPSLYKKQS